MCVRIDVRRPRAVIVGPVASVPAMLEMGVRLLLGGVLVGAAVAKLARPAAGREALAGLGFATPGTQALAFWALIVVELGLAIAVVAGSTEAAWLGAALMLLFALTLVGAIVRGRAGEPCGCFGAGSRIGWLGVVRNLALAAGFTVVAVTDSTDLSTDQWLGLGLIGALAACAGLGVATLALAREVGLLRLRVGPAAALEIPSEGPELGSRADLVGSIKGTRESELALAVFTSVGCHVCEALRPAVESIAAHPAVAVGTFDEHADAPAWSALDVPGSPYAVALDPDGTVLAKGTFNNLAQLESILAAGERRRGSLVAHG
jgi:Methylamine utilisation protein MauE